MIIASDLVEIRPKKGEVEAQPFDERGTFVKLEREPSHGPRRHPGCVHVGAPCSEQPDLASIPPEIEEPLRALRQRWGIGSAGRDRRVLARYSPIEGSTHVDCALWLARRGRCRDHRGECKDSEQA